MNTNALQIDDLRFTWPGRRGYHIAVPRLVVEAGKRVLVTGPSGSGKSTLLNLIAGLAAPDSGAIHVGGEDMAALSGSRRDRLRADQIGLIFQQLNLVPYLSPVQNACLPMRFSRRRLSLLSGGPEQEARRLFAAMGLADDVIESRAAELSIGQQQRVAAARALIGSPPLVLADEPTSALDADSRGRFMDLLLTELAKARSALIMVSHDMSLAPRFDAVLSLNDIATTGTAR